MGKGLMITDEVFPERSAALRAAFKRAKVGDTIYIHRNKEPDFVHSEQSCGCGIIAFVKEIGVTEQQFLVMVRREDGH